MPSSKQDVDTGTANSQQLWYWHRGPQKTGPPEVSRRRWKDLRAPPYTANLSATDRSQGNKKHPYPIVYQPLVSPSALMVRSKLTESGLVKLCGTLNQTKTNKQERKTGGEGGLLVKETKGSKSVRVGRQPKYIACMCERREEQNLLVHWSHRYFKRKTVLKSCKIIL